MRSVEQSRIRYEEELRELRKAEGAEIAQNDRHSLPGEIASGHQLIHSRKRRRDRQAAARYALASMEKDYSPWVGLKAALLVFTDPELRALRATEREERRRCLGVGIPSGEEPATEIMRRVLALIRCFTHDAAQFRISVGEAIRTACMTPEQRLRQAVQENLERPEDQRLSHREIARRFGVHPEIVNRIARRCNRVTHSGAPCEPPG